MKKCPCFQICASPFGIGVPQVTVFDLGNLVVRNPLIHEQL